MAQYLDLTGLQEYHKKIKNYIDGKLAGYVAKVDGYGLSKNDFTDDLKNKLDGIAAGAQVNKIETIVIGGVTATVSDKTITHSFETTVSESTNAPTTKLLKSSIEAISGEIAKRALGVTGGTGISVTKDNSNNYTVAVTENINNAATNFNSAIKTVATGDAVGQIKVTTFGDTSTNVTVNGITKSTADTITDAVTQAGTNTGNQITEYDTALRDGYTGTLKSLKTSIDTLATGRTKFLGVKTALPTSEMTGGDIVAIAGAANGGTDATGKNGKEYIYDAATETWIELGDTTAELAAISDLDERLDLVEGVNSNQSGSISTLETKVGNLITLVGAGATDGANGSVVNTFGGKKGAITVTSATKETSDDTLKVKLSMDNNALVAEAYITPIPLTGSTGSIESLGW